MQTMNYFRTVVTPYNFEFIDYNSSLTDCGDVKKKRNMNQRMNEVNQL